MTPPRPIVPSVSSWRQALRRFASDRNGATAMEYGVIACLISIAIIASVTQLGTSVAKLFNVVTNGVARVN